MRAQEALVGVDIFAGVPHEIIDDLVQRGVTRQFQPGKEFITQGDADSGLQVLLEGTATVLVYGEQVGTLSAGDYLGEMSLIDSAPRSASVVAGPEGVRTFSLSPLAFRQTLDANPSMARALLAALVGRIRTIEAASHEH